MPPPVLPFAPVLPFSPVLPPTPVSTVAPVSPVSPELGRWHLYHPVRRCYPHQWSRLERNRRRPEDARLAMLLHRPRASSLCIWKTGATNSCPVVSCGPGPSLHPDRVPCPALDRARNPAMDLCLVVVHPSNSPGEPSAQASRSPGAAAPAALALQAARSVEGVVGSQMASERPRLPVGLPLRAALRESTAAVLMSAYWVVGHRVVLRFFQPTRSIPAEEARLPEALRVPGIAGGLPLHVADSGSSGCEALAAAPLRIVVA